MAKTSQNSIFKIRYSLIFDLVHHCMSMPNVSKVVLDLDMIRKHIFLDPDPVSKLHRCHKIFQSFFHYLRNMIHYILMLDLVLQDKSKSRASIVCLDPDKSQNHSFQNPDSVSKIHFWHTEFLLFHLDFQCKIRDILILDSFLNTSMTIVSNVVLDWDK